MNTFFGMSKKKLTEYFYNFCAKWKNKLWDRGIFFIIFLFLSVIINFQITSGMVSSAAYKHLYHPYVYFTPLSIPSLNTQPVALNCADITSVMDHLLQAQKSSYHEIRDGGIHDGGIHDGLQSTAPNSATAAEQNNICHYELHYRSDVYTIMVFLGVKIDNRHELKFTSQIYRHIMFSIGDNMYISDDDDPGRGYSFEFSRSSCVVEVFYRFHLNVMVAKATDKSHRVYLCSVAHSVASQIVERKLLSHLR